MSKLKVKFGEIILREQVMKHLSEKYGPDADFSGEKLTYQVEGVSFNTLIAMGDRGDFEGVNESFVDEVICDGYLAGEISYEFVEVKDGLATIQVTIGDISDLLNEIENG